MMVTEDLYMVPTTESENEYPMLATCTLCGSFVNLNFRDVHSERCSND